MKAGLRIQSSETPTPPPSTVTVSNVIWVESAPELEVVNEADVPTSATFSPKGIAQKTFGARIFSAPLLGLLWLYRIFVSAPLQVISGPGAGCRFYPTCSHYAVEAIEVHGPAMGLWLGLKRLLKCRPFHAGGVDLVPPSRVLRPRCERLIPAPLPSQQIFHG